jgi:hypothetical protein
MGIERGVIYTQIRLTGVRCAFGVFSVILTKIFLLMEVFTAPNKFRKAFYYILTMRKNDTLVLR